MIDAGVSGDTTQAGLQRLDFVLDRQAAASGTEHGPAADPAIPDPASPDPAIPDLAIVELGGNDLLRGVPPAETRANLAAILGKLKQRGIPVLLMGMRAPPNLGADYVADFDSIYPELAKASGAALVPFFLEPVYDRPELIQGDHVHPTARGVEAMVAATAETVIGALPADARPKALAN